MRYHVLCVDRDRQIQQLRGEMLESAGYRVSHASCHAEAVLASGDLFFDVVILGESIPNEEANRIEHAIAVISPGTAVLRQHSLALRLVEDAPEILLQSLRVCIARTRKQRAMEVRRAG
jgi:DNA-binding NtrC family response regulator